MSAFWGGFADTLLDIDKQKRTAAEQEKRDRLLAQLQSDFEAKRQEFQKMMEATRAGREDVRFEKELEQKGLDRAFRQEESAAERAFRERELQQRGEYQNRALSEQAAARKESAEQRKMYQEQQGLASVAKESNRAIDDVIKGIQGIEELDGIEKTEFASELRTMLQGVNDPNAIKAIANRELLSRLLAKKNKGVPSPANYGVLPK